MRRRGKAFVGSTALAAGAAIVSTAHAPKLIALDGDDRRFASRESSAGDAKARAGNRPVTPWPEPFAGLADYVDEERAPRGPLRIPPAADAVTIARPTNRREPVVVPAEDSVPAPAELPPSPWMATPVSDVLVDPVTNGPFRSPPLGDDQTYTGLPMVAREPQTFEFGVEPAEPITSRAPTLSAGNFDLSNPPLVSVPEPGGASILLLAPVLLWGRRRAAA